MASNKFPGPGINRLIDSDPQIVKVKMETAEFAARSSALPKDTKNDMTIRHVGNSK